MDEEKDDAHEEADAADHDVGDAEEGVPAPQQAGGRDDHALLPVETHHLQQQTNQCPCPCVDQL